MSDNRDFKRRLEIIERSIAELESADPAWRANVQRLVESILEIHGRGLERLLEIVHASDTGGAPVIDQLAEDPMVSGLLLLHSLHPLTLEARVQQALETVRPTLRATRAECELLDVAGGTVRVRILGGLEQKAAVERAIHDAAPDAALEVEGMVDAVVGFVPIASLRAADHAG